MKKMVFLLLSQVILVLSIQAQKPAQILPAFTFYKLDHTSFTNANLQAGKPNFFFFFDPNCDHCQHAAANLNQHYQDYKETEFYLVSKTSSDTITRFIKQYAPVFYGKQNVTILQDSKDEFLDKFQPIRYPGMFLYTPDKKLVDYEDNEEAMFRFINTLNKVSGSVPK